MSYCSNGSLGLRQFRHEHGCSASESIPNRPTLPQAFDYPPPPGNSYAWASADFSCSQHRCASNPHQPVPLIPVPLAALAESAGTCQLESSNAGFSVARSSASVLRAARPRSSLLTTSRCGTSIMPALRKLNAVAGSRLGHENSGIGQFRDIYLFLSPPTVSPAQYRTLPASPGSSARLRAQTTKFSSAGE